MTEPLRVCKGYLPYPWEEERLHSPECAEAAYTEADLEKFTKSKVSKYGRNNQCLNCNKEYQRVRSRDHDYIEKEKAKRKRERAEWLKKNPQPLRECKCGTKAYTEEDLELFPIKKSCLYGRRLTCKKCLSVQEHEYYSNNRERALIYNKKRREDPIYRERDYALVRKWRKENPIHKRLGSIKSTAKRRKLDFDLDLEYLKSLWEQSGGRCAMTGDKMLLNSGGRAHDYSMSVDRIDSKGGYVKGNVQLVCWWYNIAKNKRSDSETLELFQHAINHANFTPLPLHARP